jgi:hypothetical protein
VPRYERLYRGRAYLGQVDVEPVRREVAELKNRVALRPLREPVQHSTTPRRPEQLTLALAG